MTSVVGTTGSFPRWSDAVLIFNFLIFSMIIAGVKRGTGTDMGQTDFSLGTDEGGIDKRKRRDDGTIRCFI